MKIKRHLIKILAVLIMVGPSAVPFAALALPVTSRSLALGSPASSAVTTYTFSFKPGTSGNIGSIKFELCDSPLAAVGCVNTGVSNGVSFVSNGAGILSQSGISGFGIGSGTPPAPTANTFWITNGTPQNIDTSTTVTVVLQNVRNPSATNTQFYGRITTYSASDGSGEVDYGAVAVNTSNQITVSGTMPESLVFCVGTSGSNCSNITGSAVDLGVFSPLSTRTGTSVMSASTNAGEGYVVTINGTTLTSGSNTIPAMGTQTLNSSGCAVSCISTIGSSQFGTNARANNVVTATPNAFGADVTPATSSPHNGLPYGGYNTANSFRFFNGDTVAYSNGNTSQEQLFTNSYIVNVGGDQAAGVYTATLTYICTATF